MSAAHRGAFWRCYKEVDDDHSTVICQEDGCGVRISRGKKDGPKKNLSCSTMKKHLTKVHPVTWSKLEAEKQQKEKEKEAEKISQEKRDETRKGCVKVFNLKSHKDRVRFLQMSLPDVGEPSFTWDYNDPQAKAGHKSVLAEIIMDLQPPSMVNRPGYLMSKRLTYPNYKVASANYYSGLVDKMYEKGLVRVKETLQEHNPTWVASQLDGWTGAHRGYIGVITNYIHEWQRISFCLGCYPFSEAHTGANMAQFLTETLASFDLTHRNEVTTTDRASNMINMMTHLPSYYLHAPCINHLIQTAIGDELLVMNSIDNLLSSCRSVCGLFNASNKFVDALKEAQMQVMGRSESECLHLHQEVKTRWNSSYEMLLSISRVQEALQEVLSQEQWKKSPRLAEVKIQWSLLAKLLRVLKDFYDATEQLSHGSSCISEVVPTVFMLRESLELITEEDNGVKTWKKHLLGAVTKRMAVYESIEHFALATVLDPRYKLLMFRDRACAATAKAALIHRVRCNMPETVQEVAAASTSTASTSPDCSLQQKMKRRKLELELQVLGEPGQRKDTAETVVEEYLARPTETDECLRYWAREEAAAGGNPAKLALIKCAERYLTPPATSTAVERLFSGAGLILEDKRQRTGPERLNGTLFLRENLLMLNFSLDW